MTAESRLTYGVIFTQIAFKPCEKAKYEILFAALSRPGVIALSGGLPDISSLPLDQVAECARAALLLRDLGLFSMATLMAALSAEGHLQDFSCSGRRG